MKTLWNLFIWTWALLGLGCVSTSSPTDSVQQGVYTTSWSMTKVFPGDSTHVGADGIAFGTWAGVPSVVTAFEGSGKVGVVPVAGGATITLNSGSGSGPEDVKFCDLDKDGLDDIVVANSGNSRVGVFWGGTTTFVTITASQTHGRYMQVDCGDFNGDGWPDIVAGSYSTNATLAVLYNPGTRLGTTWTYEQVSLEGWAMSVVAVDMDGDGDLDVFNTDRSAISGPTYTYMGIRWMEHVTGVPAPYWVLHTVLGAPYSGDQMFGLVTDYNGDGYPDILGVRSHLSQPNYVDIYLGPAFTSHTVITDSNTNNGHAQGLAMSDVNKDGVKDIVISGWESNTCCDNVHSGVWWLNGAVSWEREEISGGDGTKQDNVLVDAAGNVWGSEQLDNNYGFGIVRYDDPF